MKISYSAPAKVILSGEHAVVYGKPALVSAINLRLKLTVTNLARPRQDSNLDKGILFISNKVKNFLKEQRIQFVDKLFDYKIESEIPIGRGLGSSAALSVASVAAFLEFYAGRQFDKELINKMSFEIEKYFHKSPSGVDNSAVCFGGIFIYRKTSSLSKNINNLDFKIPKNIDEKLFLIDSGKPKETTGEMVESVKSVKSVESVNDILNKIELETKNIEVAIKNQDINLFKDCLVNNERLLEELGVVSEKTKELLFSLHKFGVGKVTGAGGRETNSGFILFFAENKKGLNDYLINNKINYCQFIPDYQGLICI